MTATPAKTVAASTTTPAQGRRRTTAAASGKKRQTTTATPAAAVETAKAIDTAAAAGFSLPDLDAAAVAPQQPALSYKLAFGDTQRWYCSRDNGASSEPTASAAVAGAIVDLSLQISPAHHREGHDYRLRLAFLQTNGELAELNLNAVSASPTGSNYITSPARSLTGALLTISDTEDDMHAFCQGARFSIRKGQGRGVFIETDIAAAGRWIAMSGALATLRVAKEPERFCEQITLLKNRFRSCGLLLSTPAVLRATPPEDAETSASGSASTR